MKYLLILFVILTSLTLNAQTKITQSSEVVNAHNSAKYKDSTYIFIIIPGENKTWGYDIYFEKRLIIHQPSMPGLSGNDGFKTKAHAEKVAKLVIDKIKKGVRLPSITIEEMKQLKVL